MKAWIALSTLGLAVTAAAPMCFAQPHAPLSLQAKRGFELRDSVLRPQGDGLRAHGRLCRVTPLAHWPGSVKLDLVDGAGMTVAEAVHELGEVSRLSGGCVVYTVTAHWTAMAGQTLRLTAL